MDFGAFPSMLSGPTLALQARAAAGALFQKPNFSRPWQPRARAGSDSDADLMSIYASTSSEIAVHIEMGLTSAAVLRRKQRHCGSSRVPKLLQPSQPVRLSERLSLQVALPDSESAGPSLRLAGCSLRLLRLGLGVTALGMCKCPESMRPVASPAEARGPGSMKGEPPSHVSEWCQCSCSIMMRPASCTAAPALALWDLAPGESPTQCGPGSGSA